MAAKLLAGNVLLRTQLLLKFSLGERMMALHKTQLMAVGICPQGTRMSVHNEER